MQPPSAPFLAYPQPGDLLDGKYRIERLLGEGGMGAVAKATHLVRRAPVALKFISGAILSLPGAVERFVNEGVAASQIDSDHVVKVFDVGRLPSGAPYLVMEFLDGRDLGELLSAEGPRLWAPRAVHFVLQMLRALQTAHHVGIVHRDMKPSNCFVIEKDGEPDFVKLVDFGISKVRASDDGSQNANLTRTNSALGTPLYMSPEQARSPRDVDHRSDLYSVGAILYEMLGGRTPYTSETGEYTEILFKIFTTEPQPLVSLSPDVPEGLAAVVHGALQRNRENRYGSAVEMAEALAPFADARSATLLAKFRAVRGRSMAPSTPPGAEAGGGPAGAQAGAAYGPGGTAAIDAAPRTPTVPTHIGLTRDTAPQKRATRNAILAGAVAVAAIGAIGTVVVRAIGSVHAAHASSPQATTSGGAAAAAAPNAPSRAPEVIFPPADPSTAKLSPLPAVSPENSAKTTTVTPPAARSTISGSLAGHATSMRTPQAPASEGPATTPPAASAGTPGTTLPKQLSDLKLH